MKLCLIDLMHGGLTNNHSLYFLHFIFKNSVRQLCVHYCVHDVHEVVYSLIKYHYLSHPPPPPKKKKLIAPGNLPFFLKNSNKLLKLDN